MTSIFCFVHFSFLIKFLAHLAGIGADDLLVPPHDTSTDLTDVMEQINSTFPACCCKY